MPAVLGASTAAELEETASGASSFGVEALPLPADVRDPEQVRSVVEAVKGTQL